ncbi:MAG: hypothetical protein H7222_12900 [Methylotenera sp.]|nr:hypothetical protein [Oligoflexia bacterium]
MNIPQIEESVSLAQATHDLALAEVALLALELSHFKRIFPLQELLIHKNRQLVELENLLANLTAGSAQWQRIRAAISRTETQKGAFQKILTASL